MVLPGYRGQHEDVEEYAPVSDQFDVYDQIAQEIQNTSIHSTKGKDILHFIYRPCLKHVIKQCNIFYFTILFYTILFYNNT